MIPLCSVGAILQALIAREPVERRPTIRVAACWFRTPQVTIVSANPSTEVMMVRSLGSTVAAAAVSRRRALLAWRHLLTRTTHRQLLQGRAGRRLERPCSSAGVA